MNIFRREHSNHLVPIHPDNAVSKDWIILLEASTIVGPASERLRVARTTQERKIIKRFKGFSADFFFLSTGSIRVSILSIFVLSFISMTGTISSCRYKARRSVS